MRPTLCKLGRHALSKMLQMSCVKRPAGFHMRLACPSWLLTSPLTLLKCLAIGNNRCHNIGIKNINPTDNICISRALWVSVPLWSLAMLSFGGKLTLSTPSPLQDSSGEYEEEDLLAEKLKMNWPQ